MESLFLMGRQGYQKIQDVEDSRRPSLSFLSITSGGSSIALSPLVGTPMAEMSQIDIDVEVAAEKKESANPVQVDETTQTQVAWAVNASWVVNWFLLIVKGIAYFMSFSKAVLAALVDSAVDLTSQGVLSLAEKYISKFSPNYPVGRSRLEALSVIACAFIMSTASLEVIQCSFSDLYDGLVNHQLPFLEVTMSLYIIMGIGIVLKFALWIVCYRLNTCAKSDMLEALAEDHLNDVLSNSVAIITAAIAFNTKAWWVDSTGAIFISIIIIYRWIKIIYEQVKKVVGHTAPQSFIDQLEAIARNHHDKIEVDVTRAYHFGARYNVEMEIVLPGNMTVVESHDIALALQHKIEGLADVERAFVHVDHQRRDGLEHKVERELVKSSDQVLLQGSKLKSSYSIEAMEIRESKAAVVHKLINV